MSTTRYCHTINDSNASAAWLRQRTFTATPPYPTRLRAAWWRLSELCQRRWPVIFPPPRCVLVVFRRIAFIDAVAYNCVRRACQTTAFFLKLPTLSSHEVVHTLVLFARAGRNFVFEAKLSLLRYFCCSIIRIDRYIYIQHELQDETCRFAQGSEGEALSTDTRGGIRRSREDVSNFVCRGVFFAGLASRLPLGRGS